MYIVRKVGICVALVAMAGCAAVAGTSMLPETTRTGNIREVTFDERMTPTTVQVQPGDEIRWVNRRSMPVTVEFLGDALDNVSCQSGFSNLLRRQQEMATIGPNESASLCFDRIGTVTYNARMESPVAGGQMIESGTIRVSQ